MHPSQEHLLGTIYWPIFDISRGKVIYRISSVVQSQRPMAYEHCTHKVASPTAALRRIYPLVVLVWRGVGGSEDRDGGHFVGESGVFAPLLGIAAMQSAVPLPRRLCRGSPRSGRAARESVAWERLDGQMENRSSRGGPNWSPLEKGAGLGRKKSSEHQMSVGQSFHWTGGGGALKPLKPLRL